MVNAALTTSVGILMSILDDQEHDAHTLVVTLEHTTRSRAPTRSSGLYITLVHLRYCRRRMGVMRKVALLVMPRRAAAH